MTAAGISHSLEGSDDHHRYAALASLLGRVLISPIFLLSGVAKIMNPGAYLGYIAAFGLPLPIVGLVLAVVIEIGGGLALIAGYKVRIVGSLLAAFSLATALIFHNNFADQNEYLHFWKNVAMAGGLLQLLAFGGGRLSLDARCR